MAHAKRFSANANELSLVVRLDYGDFNALFTGDIGFETEKRIMNDIAVLNCDLLKVAHHGSKYSSDKEFLANIDPSLAVISVGRNTYGHPDPETLDRLSSQGARILKTIESGGILVEVWEITTNAHNDSGEVITLFVNTPMCYL